MVGKRKKKKTRYEAYLFNWNEGMPSLVLNLGLWRIAYICNGKHLHLLHIFPVGFCSCYVSLYCTDLCIILPVILYCS